MAATAAPPVAPVTPKTDAAGIVPPAQASASSIAPPIDSQAPKPGSAREGMFKTLREKYAKPAPGEDIPPAVTPPAAKPADQAPPAAPEPKADEGTPPGQTTPPVAPKPTDPAEPDRTKDKPTKDFWRAFDTWKERAVKAETQLAEAQKGAIPEAEKQTLQARIEKAEARAKELEEHIRYVDYSKTTEYQDKYVKPYTQAWNRAWSEVQQIQVKDPNTGEERPASVADLSALVNLDLGEARRFADAVFGPFANDVMLYRKDIRSLNDAQAAALEEAKKNGELHLKQTSEQAQKQMGEIQKEIASLWTKTNETVLNDATYGKYFKQVEGDAEINQRLAKGFDLVDRAFSANPNDPKLTPEQRASIVRLHAAVRNRAAAFGRLVYEGSKKDARIAELEKELSGFKSSTPPATGQPSGQPAAGAPTGMAAIRAGLQKIARPG